MPQFDVHVNPGRNRQTFPYVVNVQSRRFDGAASRVVVPLARSPAPLEADRRLMPKLVIVAETFFLNPLAMFAAPVAVLGPVVASFAQDPEAGDIIAAIDEIITRGYG